MKRPVSQKQQNLVCPCCAKPLIPLPGMSELYDGYCESCKQNIGDAVNLDGIRCDPDVCPNCIYIGEGDSLCDVTQEIVLADWVPTEDYMGKGCPYHNAQRVTHRKKRRKKK